MSGEPIVQSRNDALSQILSLMQAHNLTISDIKLALKASLKPEKGQASKTDIIMRLFTYIGIAFIFGGIGIFVHMMWDDLPSLPRVIITLGTGIIAFILGIMFAKNEKLEKASTPAFLIAFLLQPTGLFVLLREYSDGDNVALASMLVFGVLALQQGLSFSKLKRTALLFCTVIYTLGFLGGLIEQLEIHRAFSALVIGTGFFFLTVDLHKRQDYKDLSPFFYILSTGIFYSGLYYYTGNTIFDPANLSVSLAMLMIAVNQNSKTLYILGILYVLTYLLHGPGGGWLSWGREPSEIAHLTAGASIILTAMWLRGVSYTAATPIWFFIGMSFAMGGAFGMVADTPLEVLYLAVATAGVYVSLQIKSRAALAVATISLISFLGYFSAEHFGDVIAWPLLLILTGFMILGSGLMFVKLARRISEKRAA